ncbi:MAG TPA: AraC family transcriptional regulator, partial [Pyrinomonadaceae bacterium]
MNQQEAELKQQRLQINQAEMIERISRAVPEDGLLEAFAGVFLGRFSKPTERVYSVFKPSFCIIAQGSKQMLLGEETFRYDPGHYLISTVVLPVVANVVEASGEHPYLGFQLHLDPGVVATVMMESGIKTKRSEANVKAMNVSPTDPDLLDAALKLIRLLDRPDEIKFLSPLIIREIIYRLLRG